MSQAIIDLLIELADPRALKRFDEDPEAVMSAAGLTEAEKSALRSRDSGSIHYQALGNGDSRVAVELVELPPIMVTNDFTTMDGYLEVTHVMTAAVWARKEDYRFGYMQPEVSTSNGTSDSPRGKLIVVGTGIQAGQMTVEARAWVEVADKVLYCVSDLATESLLERLNPAAESLHGLYGNDKPRLETYHEMVDRALEFVREGLTVCLVFYGHPGIFVYPGHEAIRVARSEGHLAFMLPAPSSFDCLVADLGVDPAFGCQLVEATDLLVRNRHLDKEGCVIIWQCEAVGDLGFNFNGFDKRNVPTLLERLQAEYGSDFECVVYQAAHYPICEPTIERVRLGDLADSHLKGISTLFFPPLIRAEVDVEMVKALGMDRWYEERRAAMAGSAVAVATGSEEV